MFLIYSYLILLIGQNQIRTVCRFIQNYIEQQTNNHYHIAMLFACTIRWCIMSKLMTVFVKIYSILWILLLHFVMDILYAPLTNVQTYPLLTNCNRPYPSHCNLLWILCVASTVVHCTRSQVTYSIIVHGSDSCRINDCILIP